MQSVGGPLGGEGGESAAALKVLPPRPSRSGLVRLATQTHLHPGAANSYLLGKQREAVGDAGGEILTPLGEEGATGLGSAGRCSSFSRLVRRSFEGPVDPPAAATIPLL